MKSLAPTLIGKQLLSDHLMAVDIDHRP